MTQRYHNNMLDLTIYGKPSSTYQFMKNRILEITERAEITLNLQEISDTNIFFRDEISSIPAFKIGSDLKTQMPRELNAFLREVCFWLLKKEDFGAMTQFIVPTDFSPNGNNAISYAQQLSKKRNGIVKLMHVLNFTENTNSTNRFTAISPYSESTAKARLMNLVQVTDEQWINEGLESPFVDGVFKIGFPGNEIVNYTKPKEQKSQIGQKVIVMGNSGESNILKNFFGSVSSKVVKSAKCPVFIIPPKTKYKTYNRVTICCDNDALDEKTIPRLKELMQNEAPHFSLVHAGETDHYNELKIIEKWKKEFETRKVSFHKTEKRGEGSSNVDSILEFAETDAANLIVAHRSEKGFIDGLFHSSFSKKLARNSKIPILIMPK